MKGHDASITPKNYILFFYFVFLYRFYSISLTSVVLFFIRLALKKNRNDTKQQYRRAAFSHSAYTHSLFYLRAPVEPSINCQFQVQHHREWLYTLCVSN